MNFKILCRSFEAPTKPYQIKQNQNQPRNKVAFFVDFE